MSQRRNMSSSMQVGTTSATVLRRQTDGEKNEHDAEDMDNSLDTTTDNFLRYKPLSLEFGRVNTIPK
ncbi:hypothetical protein Ddc_05695 [Ditylenchus destructor]|nr:hypothetical protein Ddc_05695 [Ditylenchus destructor]